MRQAGKLRSACFCRCLQTISETAAAIGCSGMGDTMTLREVARYFGVSRPCVQKWRDQGLLPRQVNPCPKRTETLSFWRDDIVALKELGFVGRLSERTASNEPLSIDTRQQALLLKTRDFYRVLDVLLNSI